MTLGDGGIRVNHAALDTAAADLRQKVREIDGRLDQLDGELAPLRAGWTGQAREAYDLAKREWDQAMREMRSVLDEAGVAVAQSNAEYAARDRAGAARFGG